jgi:hypothetical protein
MVVAVVVISSSTPGGVGEKISNYIEIADLQKKPEKVWLFAAKQLQCTLLSASARLALRF